MKFVRLLAIPLLAFVVGCPKPLPSVPDAPPPTTPPSVAADASIRPVYSVDGQTVAAGTGFVVLDAAGNPWFLTASHIMDNEAEWRRVKAIELQGMADNPLGNLSPSDIKWIGKPFGASQDFSSDLVVMSMPEVGSAKPVKLAAADAKQNEWVWVAGREGRGGPGQKLFRCQVTGTESTGITLKQYDKLKLMGFSGGPVFNAAGEVVGTVLAGNEPEAVMMRLTKVRECLTAAGVTVP